MAAADLPAQRTLPQLAHCINPLRAAHVNYLFPDESPKNFKYDAIISTIGGVGGLCETG